MFTIIWSALPDEGEHMVGPFPTSDDAELWAAKYLGNNDSEICWNVRRMTNPATYPAVKATKFSDYAIDIDEVALRR